MEAGGVAGFRGGDDEDEDGAGEVKFDDVAPVKCCDKGPFGLSCGLLLWDPISKRGKMVITLQLCQPI